MLLHSSQQRENDFTCLAAIQGLCCRLQVTEVYQERRLDAVFAMWDQNSDLRISFKELCEGLYRWASMHCLADVFGSFCACQQ